MKHEQVWIRAGCFIMNSVPSLFMITSLDGLVVVCIAMSLPSPDTPCTEFLTELSVTFRDPEERHTYVSRHPDFSTWLHTVVQRTIQDAALEERIAVCKLVANFVADDGGSLASPSRTRLISW